MSSRRKSTTPCMVLAAEVLEHKEVEEKTERSNEEEVEEEEEGKVKEGAEEGPNSEELDQAVVLTPAPSEAGKMTSLT